MSDGQASFEVLSESFRLDPQAQAISIKLIINRMFQTVQVVYILSMFFHFPSQELQYTAYLTTSPSLEASDAENSGDML